MKFCFLFPHCHRIFLASTAIFPQNIAKGAKRTLRHDMNGTIVSHKISFVNYFAVEK